LNLFLEVLAKRADGFHEIETLMIAISICDTLFVSENSEGRIRLSCNWAAGMASRQSQHLSEALGDLPSPTENIVYRAADRLRICAGMDAGATIHLVKRIPSAAGMGGASSDAAAVIVALNQLWRLGWTTGRLAELASEIGSDVPFFVSDAGSRVRAAVCRGRGERIEREGVVPPLHLVVVKPPAGLATASVYRNCRIPNQPRDCLQLLRALRHGDAADVGCLLFNRLQETAEQLCPWIGRLRSVFDQVNLLGHQMSGSGTSYFGICRHRRHARQVAARLRGHRIGEVVCGTTGSV
jgi:4-diphosphocytidyl-2-C-methyl-D-erythritol kinase